MNFEPFGDRVVIKPDTADTSQPKVSAGGIELVSPGEESPEITTGIVVAVGADCSDRENGNRVVYSPWSGHNLTVDGVFYKILSSGEILGRLTEDAQAQVA